MKAIILAAEQGATLRPVTLTIPKALVPVANKPLITHTVEMIRDSGLTEIGIIIHSLESPICAVLSNGSTIGVNIRYIVQQEQLGSAHAVSLTKEFVGNEPFGVFPCDNLLQNKMGEIIHGFTNSPYEALVALSEVADPLRFTLAKIKDDKIIRLMEISHPSDNLAVCGVYLFRHSIFDAIASIKPSWRNELEITDTIAQILSRGHQVQAYKINGWWIRTRTPDHILQANRLGSVCKLKPEQD